MSAAELVACRRRRCVLVVAFSFFRLRLDRRRRRQLAAATVLWIGFAHLADYLLYASLLGGALTLLLIQFRALPLPPCWSAAMGRAAAPPRRWVPYGIALAAAALVDLSADRVDDSGTAS